MIDLLLEGVYLQVVLLDEPCSLYVELLDHKNHGLHMVPHALILLLKGLIEVKDVLAAVTEAIPVTISPRCSLRTVLVSVNELGLVSETIINVVNRGGLELAQRHALQLLELLLGLLQLSREIASISLL